MWIYPLSIYIHSYVHTSVSTYVCTYTYMYMFYSMVYILNVCVQNFSTTFINICVFYNYISFIARRTSFTLLFYFFNADGWGQRYLAISTSASA